MKKKSLEWWQMQKDIEVEDDVKKWINKVDISMKSDAIPDDLWLELIDKDRFEQIEILNKSGIILSVREYSQLRNSIVHHRLDKTEYLIRNLTGKADRGSKVWKGQTDTKRVLPAYTNSPFDGGVVPFLIGLMASRNDSDVIAGDLEEMWATNASNNGPACARRWLWYEITLLGWHRAWAIARKVALVDKIFEIIFG